MMTRALAVSLLVFGNVACQSQSVRQARAPDDSEQVRVEIFLKDVHFVGPINSAFQLRVDLRNDSATNYEIFNPQMDSRQFFFGELIVTDRTGRRLPVNLNKFTRRGLTASDCGVLLGGGVIGGTPIVDLGGGPLAYPLMMQFVVWKQREVIEELRFYGRPPTSQKVRELTTTPGEVWLVSNTITVTRKQVETSGALLYR